MSSGLALRGLDKYRSLTTSSPSTREEKGDGGKIGSAGQEIIEFGSHAVLALATKNMPDGVAGIQQLKPDLLGLGAAALALMLGKGKTRKVARSAAKGAGHAMITRFVNTSHIEVISGPNGTRLHQADAGV